MHGFLWEGEVEKISWVNRERRLRGMGTRGSALGILGSLGKMEGESNKRIGGGISGLGRNLVPEKPSGTHKDDPN